MKTTVLLLSLASAIVLAIDAPSASQAITNPQSAINNPQSTIIEGANAVTISQMLSYQGRLTDTTGIIYCMFHLEHEHYVRP